ncbi:MAG: antibiotic biosynthesis monooxygenase family protein [Candidatus Kariarchaeaceae archaeon]|jgi:heme-degrading monooxygenase HmoA
MAKFTYVWKYQAKPEFKSDFEKAYGPSGDWSQLFTKAEGYIKTELMHERDNPDWYITVDYWESYDAVQVFRKKFSQEFLVLDEKCERFTNTEIYLGDFDIVS